MARFDRFGATPENVTVKSSTGVTYVDWKNADALRKLMSPNGKIYGRKRTGMTAYQQRRAAQAVKRARYMALLPYTSGTL